jgi:hypothetical protein
MGGGTGCGAGPVVADIARQQGAFTVAIAATPTSLTARQSSTRVRWPCSFATAHSSSRVANSQQMLMQHQQQQHQAMGPASLERFGAHSSTAAQAFVMLHACCTSRLSPQQCSAVLCCADLVCTPAVLFAAQHVKELYQAADALVMLPTHKLLAGEPRQSQLSISKQNSTSQKLTLGLHIVTDGSRRHSRRCRLWCCEAVALCGALQDRSAWLHNRRSVGFGLYKNNMLPCWAVRLYSFSSGCWAELCRCPSPLDQH